MGSQRIDPRWNQGLADVLNIKTLQSSPTSADLDSCTIVVDGNQAGFAVPGTIAGVSANTAINGVATKRFDFVYPFSSTGSGTVVASNGSNQDQQVRILAADVTIFFDAAGEAAFNTKVLQAVWSLIDIASNNNALICEQRYTVSTNGSYQRRYRLPLGNLVPNYFVPATCRLYCDVHVNDGTNYPANTTAIASWVGIRRSVGAQLPL